MNKIYLIAFLLLWPLNVWAQDGLPPIQTKASPVVVELFSSENCPACPPADKFLQGLTKSAGVIALSCHVDYFGRTSTNLGQSFCTDRQSRYIEQIKRKSYFTPQMMINGHMSEIGYEHEAVSAAIVKGRSERVSEIIIQPKSAGVYSFSLPARESLAETTDLILAVYDKPHQVNERGRKMTYDHVVSKLLSLGTWGGGQMNSAVYPLVTDESAGFVIIAQERKSGKILAAGEYRL